MGNTYLEAGDRRLSKCKNNVFDMKFSKLINTVLKESLFVTNQLC